MRDGQMEDGIQLLISPALVLMSNRLEVGLRHFDAGISSTAKYVLTQGLRTYRLPILQS